MSDRDDTDPLEGRSEMPRPRLGWLALSQAIIITLVVLMAHETRGLAEGPLRPG